MLNNLFTQNKKILTVFIGLILFIAIIALILFIFFPSLLTLDTFNPQKRGYQDLKGQIENLQKDNAVASIPLFQRFVAKIETTEDPKMSEKDRYDTIALSYLFLRDGYSASNNPKLNGLEKKVTDFARKSYPKYFKNGDFPYFCQDSSCATTPQPKEILNIIEMVKKSDFPDAVKKTTEQDLLNIGYLDKNKKSDLFDNYAFMGAAIYSYNSFTKTNANKNISNAIYTYLHKNFPEQYTSALKSPEATKAGFIKF